MLNDSGQLFVTFNSKNNPSFRRASNKRVDEHTVIKTTGIEAGIPHTYVDHEDIAELLSDYRIKKLQQIEDYDDGGSSVHFFIEAEKKAQARREAESTLSWASQGIPMLPTGPLRARLRTMDVPDYFLAKASRQFGEQGHEWARQLPSIADHCKDAWELTDCAPVEDLSINFVCLCTSRRHGDVVLKIQGPHTERYTEIEALQIFDGRNCCRMLALDLPSAAMLLKRVKPGLPLRELKDRSRQLAVGTAMIAKAPVPVTAQHHLPTYSQWLETARETLSRSGAPAALQILLRNASEQYQSLTPDGSRLVLLHGDLHHDNILQAGASSWVAIDPQGVIGPPVLEAGRFIQNHVLFDSGPVDWHEVLCTIDDTARSLRESRARVLKSLFILHTLSACWDWEMRANLDGIERTQEQCTHLLLRIIEDH